MLHCACQKPKELGYSYELWTYALLQTHVRQQCVEAQHPSLQQLSRSRLHKILTQGEIRPHKIRSYVERRDPQFAPKMVEVLHVYKEVEIVNQELVQGTLKETPRVTISYDEKPGIQAIAVTQAGSTLLGRNTEVSGKMSMKNGKRSIQMLEFLSAGAHSRLRSASGEADSRMLGAGEVVEFDAGKVLETWMASVSTYERLLTKPECPRNEFGRPYGIIHARPFW